jgi:hypothetical protein
LKDWERWRQFGRWRWFGIQGKDFDGAGNRSKLKLRFYLRFIIKWTDFTGWWRVRAEGNRNLLDANDHYLSRKLFHCDPEIPKSENISIYNIESNIFPKESPDW